MRSETPSAGDLVGYTRLSTLEQETALQRDALQAAGRQRSFTDKCVRGHVAVSRDVPRGWKEASCTLTVKNSTSKKGTASLSGAALTPIVDPKTSNNLTTTSIRLS